MLEKYRCTFAVYFLVFFGISWNPRMEAEVAVILYVDGASIFSGGTFSGMGAEIYAAAFQRAAVFVCIFYGIITPWTHFMPASAEGMSGGCGRHYSDPDASWGWDSDNKTWYFGHTLYMLCRGIFR